jgi:hypothetical protein
VFEKNSCFHVPAQPVGSYIGVVVVVVVGGWVDVVVVVTRVVVVVVAAPPVPANVTFAGM